MMTWEEIQEACTKAAADSSVYVAIAGRSSRLQVDAVILRPELTGLTVTLVCGFDEFIKVQGGQHDE